MDVNPDESPIPDVCDLPIELDESIERQLPVSTKRVNTRNALPFES